MKLDYLWKHLESRRALGERRRPPSPITRPSVICKCASETITNFIFSQSVRSNMTFYDIFIKICTIENVKLNGIINVPAFPNLMLWFCNPTDGRSHPPAECNEWGQSASCIVMISFSPETRSHSANDASRKTISFGILRSHHVTKKGINLARTCSVYANSSFYSCWCCFIDLSHVFAQSNTTNGVSLALSFTIFSKCQLSHPDRDVWYSNRSQMCLHKKVLPWKARFASNKQRCQGCQCQWQTSDPPTHTPPLRCCWQEAVTNKSQQTRMNTWAPEGLINSPTVHFIYTSDSFNFSLLLTNWLSWLENHSLITQVLPVPAEMIYVHSVWWRFSKLILWPEPLEHICHGNVVMMGRHGQRVISVLN